MLIIDERAAKYAKDRGLSFEVKAVPLNLECWNGTTTQVMSLKTKVVFEGEIDKELFHQLQSDGVKVYISRELNMDEDIKIIQRKKLPFTKPAFGVIGVRI